MVTISRRVQKSCFWVGTRLLGMREKYPKYEAGTGVEWERDEKRELMDKAKMFKRKLHISNQCIIVVK
jgi:hypothetical protein